MITDTHSFLKRDQIRNWKTPGSFTYKAFSLVGLQMLIE